MSFAAIVFGWPAVILSGVITAAAIAWHRGGIAILGVVVGMPALFYLAATPRFQYVAPVVAILYAAAPVALSRRKRLLAWLLWAPFIALMAWLGVVAAGLSV